MRTLWNLFSFYHLDHFYSFVCSYNHLWLICNFIYIQKPESTIWKINRRLVQATLLLLCLLRNWFMNANIHHTEYGKMEFKYHVMDLLGSKFICFWKLWNYVLEIWWCQNICIICIWINDNIFINIHWFGFLFLLLFVLKLYYVMK